jgi:diacylglycerol kinase family enzyme
VTFENGDHVADGYFTVVLNTNPYTYLGNRPLDLSPVANLENGFVVITFRTLRVTAVLKALAGALRGGGVKPSAYLDVHEDVDALTIRHHVPFPYHLDGDYLGEITELDFRHVRDAVRLVRPNTGQ